MKLVFYEIKKLICNKIFLITTFIVLAFFAFMMYSAQKTFVDFDDISKGAVKLTHQLESGEISLKELSQYQQDKFLDAMPGQPQCQSQGLYCSTLFDDVMLATDILDAATYCSDFETQMQDAVILAAQNMVNAKQSGDKALEKYYSMMIDTYNSPKNVSCMYTTSVNKFFNLFYSGLDTRTFNLLLIIWTVFVTAYSLGCEKLHYTGKVVYSTKRGRSNLLAAKLTAIICTVSGMLLIICLMEIAFGIFFMGFASLDKSIFTAPLQMLPDYRFCGMNISIAGYYLLNNLLRLIAMLTAVAITAVVSVRLPNMFVTSAIVTVLLGTPLFILLEKLAENKSVSDNFRLVFPVGLIMSDNYFRNFDYAIVGDLVVNRLAVCSVIAVAVIITCIAVAFRYYERTWKINER